MNNIIKNVVMIPFLLILVASMASGFQYSNASASGTETDESVDTSSSKTSNVSLNAVTCSAASNPCWGTDGNDDMTGDNGINNMSGKKGSDIISGRGAGDIISGDQGSDTVNGENGVDQLHGGDGDDNVNGGGGNDVMAGGEGDDIMHGGDYDDSIRGGPGNDIINGGRHNDNIYGGQGPDSIRGGQGNDKIYHMNSDMTAGLSSPDGSKDTIDCGPGNDEAWINTADGDVVTNCETVHKSKVLSPGEAPLPPPLEG